MKISPMIKSVICITYSALILLSIIILWCVFTSTVESFGSSSEKSSDKSSEKSSDKSSESCPSCPSAPSCTSSTEDGGDSPDSDEILCPNAPYEKAKTSEYVGHNDKMCSYLTDKSEKTCNERHVVNHDNGDKFWCEWKDGECIEGGSCGGEGGSSEPTIEEGQNMIVTELMNESAINTLINKINARYGYVGGYAPDVIKTRWTNMAKSRYAEMRGGNYGKTHEEAYNAARNWICFGNGGAGDALSDDCSPLR